MFGEHGRVRARYEVSESEYSHQQGVDVSCFFAQWKTKVVILMLGRVRRMEKREGARGASPV